jgi:hypothetical protein
MPIPRFSPREKMKQENLPPMKGDTYNIYCCYAPRVERRAPHPPPSLTPETSDPSLKKRGLQNFALARSLTEATNDEQSRCDRDAWNPFGGTLFFIVGRG